MRRQLAFPTILPKISGVRRVATVLRENPRKPPPRAPAQLYFGDISAGAVAEYAISSSQKRAIPLNINPPLGVSVNLK